MNIHAKHNTPLINNRVVILAGGKGTRLRPFTASFPKPLVPVGDLPIMEVLLRQLSSQGFVNYTLALGHLSGLIRAYVAQRKSVTGPLNISFVDEDEPTGTAGSLSNIEGLDEPFLAMNGDVLTDLNYADFLKDHNKSGAALTIAAHAKEVKIDLGVLEADEDGNLHNYIEKPTIHHDVSMGVYAYSPRVLKFIPKGEYLDFPNLVLKLMEAGETVRLYRNNAFWLDIGHPEDYALAQELMENTPEKFGMTAYV